MNTTAKQDLHVMTPQERRAAMSLASIFSMRMLGLFMILPVFSLYIDDISGATPALMGLAIGIYGLTQGILQIPFGLLSDRLGRKPVIAAGLLLFVIGSVVAAMSDNIYGLILGRALQGGGAIAAAVMALAADLTREEVRTKAMAIIGMSIGASFALALLLGPIINHWIGLHGIFWFIAALATCGIVVLLFVVPTPVQHRMHRDAQPVPAQFRRILTDTQLLRLDFGIFVLHMILTSVFVVFPLVLQRELGIAPGHHWWIYLPVLLFSVAAMVPFIIIAERKRRMKDVFVGAVLVLSLALLGMSVSYTHIWLLVLCLFVFFTAFNLLEATLPSLVSKVAPPDSKGTAMGFYSSSQFFGAFLGGSLGGVVLGKYGYAEVFLLASVMGLIWFGFASTMKSPSYLSSYVLPVGKITNDAAKRLAEELGAIEGVAEAIVIAQDEVAYLKVDRKLLDEDRLQSYAVTEQGLGDVAH